MRKSTTKNYGWCTHCGCLVIAKSRTHRCGRCGKRPDWFVPEIEFVKMKQEIEELKTELKIAEEKMKELRGYL